MLNLFDVWKRNPNNNNHSNDDKKENKNDDTNENNKIITKIMMIIRRKKTRTRIIEIRIKIIITIHRNEMSALNLLI